MPKTFVGEVFCAAFEKASVAKISMDNKGGGVVSRFSVEIFLSHCAENFHRGTLLCCVSECFRERITLWITRGLSRFSVEIFLARYAENFRKGTLLCCVSENFR